MSINEDLLGNYSTESWNSAIVGELASYQKDNDPTLRGYSKRNLYAMAAFYEKYSNAEFYSFAKQIMLRSSIFGKLFPASGWKKLPEIAEINSVKPGRALSPVTF